MICDTIVCGYGKKEFANRIESYLTCMGKNRRTISKALTLEAKSRVCITHRPPCQNINIHRGQRDAVRKGR